MHTLRTELECMGKERMNRSKKTVRESVLNTVPKISDYFVQTFGSGDNPKKLSYLHDNLSRAFLNPISRFFIE